MADPTIEKNKIENTDLEQIGIFSDLPISSKEIIVMERNDSLAITMRKFLTEIGFDDIYVCNKISDCVKIFSDFINREMSVTIIIDDNISYKSTKKIVEEVFDIQPNANIIIITTKEKNNVEILELLDKGISSVIQKPLTFQAFSNVFSHMVDKENHPQITKTEQDFEAISSASDRISQNKIQDTLKVETAKIEEMIGKSEDARNISYEKEILEAACNQCNSTNITYIAECPNCGGINFKQQTLIEHYRCGEVFPKEINNNSCPKCNQDMGTAGTDYREFTDFYVCNSCNDRFPKPTTRFNCLDCNNLFIERLANWKKGRKYKVKRRSGQQT